MSKTNLLIKSFDILSYRLKTDGLGVTLNWFWTRLYPKLTGKPVLHTSQITPQIFVGTQFGAAGKQLLERNGIHYDVNLREEFDDAAHGLALKHYCYLPTPDDHDPSIEQLEQGIAFIEQAVKDNGRVYIHCAGGIGRAPTMAAAYFMRQGMTLDEALALIRKVRPFIRIMPPQMALLKRFESHR